MLVAMTRPNPSPRPANRPRSRRRSRGAIALTTIAATLVVVPAASAINYVSAQNGESWAVNDAAMPGLDTGSIRQTNHNSLLGYGGIKVSVSGTKADRLDGELLELLGRAAEALAAYDRALILDPQAGVTRRAEKIRKQIGGAGAAPPPRSRFEQQAERLGIKHERLRLETSGPKQWRFASTDAFRTVEEAALASFLSDGWSGAAAEGGLILTLIKAASFARLPARSADTFIEALYQQNVAFEEDRYDAANLIEAVRGADLAQLEANWSVICATAGTTPAFYPRVTWDHVSGLFSALGTERLAKIAQLFAAAPYDLRAGWPDLTLWRGKELRFVEVKSPSDQMHASQARLISTILVPLGFDVTLLEIEKAAA